MNVLEKGQHFSLRPRKTKDEMATEGEIAQIFCAVCWLSGITFKYRERNQNVISGVKGFADVPEQKKKGVWVDGNKIGIAFFHICEVDIHEKVFLFSH